MSGRIDNIRECYKNWKKYLLDIYNTDIFLHCSIPNRKDKLFIENVIKPKKVIYHDLNKDKPSLEDLLDLQIYRIYKCNQIKNEYSKVNGVEYEFNIKSRSDILYLQKFNLDTFLNDKDIIYIPVKYKHRNSSNLFGLGVTDQLFIGSKNSMNIACDFFLYQEKYKNISCKFPEIKLLKYLKENNITIKYFNFHWDIYYYSKLSNNGFLSKKYLSKVPDILDRSCFINL
jgi:hypothetical protein